MKKFGLTGLLIGLALALAGLVARTMPTTTSAQGQHELYLPHIVVADFSAVTQTPTATSTVTVTPTVSETPIPTNTVEPTMTPTPSPTANDTPTVTSTPTATETPTPTATYIPLTKQVTANAFTTSGRPETAWYRINDAGGCFGYDEQRWLICATFVRLDHSGMIGNFSLDRADLVLHGHSCFYCQQMIVDVCPVLGDWVESELTWNTMPAVAPDTECVTRVIDPPYIGIPKLANTPEEIFRNWRSTTKTNTDWQIRLDITPLLRKVLSGELSDYGYRIAGRSLGDWYLIDFRSQGPELSPREEIWGLPSKR